MRPWVLKREIALWRTLLRHRRAPSHRLPAPLYISVTSHPPRYKYLRQSLLSLLVQDTRPDGVLLWIEHADLADLPTAVRALQRFGLKILPCEDGLRSYGKIVPALERYSDAYIAIADDDHLYPRDWLSGLVAAQHPTEVAYYRGHRMRFAADGLPKPYRDWDWEIDRQLDGDIVLPTGVGGVMYPPRSLDLRAVERSLFEALAPTSDDLWLRWMAQLQGTGFRKVTPSVLPEALPTANIASLSSVNSLGEMANDTAVKALVSAFGLPRTASAQRTERT